MDTAAKPLRKAEIARHWGVSPAYVTQALKRHTLPGEAELVFFTLEEADDWRAEHAPAKPANELHRQSSKEIQVEAEKKSRSFSPPTPRKSKAAAGERTGGGDGGPATGTEAGGDGYALAYADATTRGERRSGEGRGRDAGHQRIDVTQFVERGGDFVAITLRQSEEVPQIAYGLFKRACAGGNPVAVSQASANWSAAARDAAAVRERYLDIQERERNLIPLDLVMDVVGTELQAVRSFLLTLSDRVAAKANPQEPATAKAVIEGAVDELMKSMEAMPQRVAGETENRAAEAAAA